MTNWNEADHPRDDEGKFTYKGGGNSNSSNNSLSQKSNEEKMQNRANLLYDSMNEKDNKNKVLLGEISKDVYQEPNKSNFSDFLSNIVTQPQVPQYNVTQNSLLSQIAVDHINNPALKEIATKAFGLETAENLLMSKKDTYLNTDYAKEHLIFKNYKELSPDLKDYFEKKITSKIGRDKLDNTGGIYINAKHQSSKKLNKALPCVGSPKFQNQHNKTDNNKKSLSVLWGKQWYRVRIFLY